MATLVITEGPSAGEKLSLTGHRIALIGRDADCTFQVLDDQMSRRHLQIKVDEATGTHQAVDFKSTNGVTVNGMRIDAAQRLLDGDQIGAGSSIIVYVLSDDPEAHTFDEILRKRGERRRSTIVEG